METGLWQAGPCKITSSFHEGKYIESSLVRLRLQILGLSEFWEESSWSGQHLFQWEKPNKAKGIVAISKSKEEVEKPPAHAGRRECVGLRRQLGLLWVVAGCWPRFLQNHGQQNLPLSGCAADYLITDIHGGFGALRMGMPCANANVTARSTTRGPRWLVLFYCFSSIIMFNSCVVSSKCLSLRAWPHLLK